MDYVKRNRQIANSYYNAGLKKARTRDLTGAVQELKKSLRFDKYQMDARNLLGLIFYEMGETADALVQWVISMNLKPKDNPAERYLAILQRRPGQLKKEGKVIQNYNQALVYANTDNLDLAALQLIKVVEERPGFVKAHLLLALIYMEREDYPKAGKSLFKVLQIDKSNPKAQWYMAIVKKNTGREEVEKKKLKNAFSHRRMQDDDIIVPPEFKENTGWSSILNICAGLLMGMLAVYFLLIPARTKALNVAHNQELITYSQKMDELNQELAQVNGDYGSLEERAGEMEERLAAIEGENQELLSQYHNVISILQAYRSDDLVTAAQYYVSLDASKITDAHVISIIESIETQMLTTGFQTLEDLGTQSWNAGKKQQALEYYQKSLAVKPDNTAAMYLLGRLYQDLGNTEAANNWFTKIIDEFPASSQAASALEARGY